jgi:WD40 repeat protein
LSSIQERGSATIGHEADAGSAPPASVDVFVSYAREDGEFVRGLADELAARGHPVWLDATSIPLSAEWWAEIERGIASAAAFVFILSPDSVASGACARELRAAEAHATRIVPVVRRDVEGLPVPDALAERQWLFFRECDDPQEALDALVETIETDLEHERLVAWLRVRTSEWEARGRERGALLRGAELATAEELVASSPGDVAEPGRQYVLASRRAVVRFQRRTIAAVAVALVVAIGLSVVALILRGEAVHQQHAAQSRALSAGSLLALDNDPELSLLLARQAVRTQATPQAQQALREALASSHVRLTATAPRGALMLAELTPDERELVAVGGTGPAYVFDARTGRRLRTLRSARYKRPLWYARLSADGSELLILPNIGPPVALDVAGRRPPVKLTDPSDTWFVGAALSPDGRRAVAVTLHTGVAHLYDTRTGRVLTTFRGRYRGVLSYSPDGRFVALTRRGTSTAVVQDLTGGAPVVIPTDAQSQVDVAFTPRGSLVVATDRDARVYDPRTGHAGPRLAGARAAASSQDRSVGTAVSSLSFSRDGRWTIGLTGHGEANVWDLATGRRTVRMKASGHEELLGPVLSPHGSTAVTSGTDGIGRVWDTTTGQVLTELRGVPGGIRAVASATHGTRVVTAGQDGTARIWDAGLGLPQSRRPLPQSLQEVPDVALGARWATDLSVGSSTGNVFDARSGDVVFPVELEHDAWHVALADRAAVMAVSYEDAPVELFDVAHRRSLGTLADAWKPGTTPTPPALDLSADGRRALVGTGGDLTVWDVPTRRRLGRLHLPTSEPGTKASAFSPDDRLVATVTDAGVVVLWQASDGRIIARERAERSPGFNASVPVRPAFSPDGSLVAAAGNWDRTPGIWRTSDGAQVAALTQPFSSVAFSPTAPLVVTDGPAVWDARSGRLLVRLGSPSQDPGSSAAFTSDGLRVVTGTGSVYSCDVCGPLPRLMRLADRRITRQFKPTERARYLR